MDWAAIVSWVRERQGLKQAAFAHLMDVDQATVSRWECRKQTPCLAIRNKLTQIVAQMDPDQDLAMLDEHLANRQDAIAGELKATLLTEIEGAKATAELLTAHLASDTALAGALTARLASVESSVEGIVTEAGAAEKH